ncbi:c-type cytochrome [Pontibaca salina]|uniref:Cytochrome c family protein n=1 Tax=Pontibaca salina TaxID=2795731 RepID=A0A934LXS4_9RHOB|nr:cytochrome c family protein [Pontibaca salina]MBI6628962.1 cytochrome c family protein [Pontibaca salina]
MIRQLFASAAVIGALSTSAFAAGDAEKGERVFRKCQACHQVGDNAKNRVGPVLNDIIGRTAGTVEGFNYSDALKQAGEDGIVWSDEHLHEYLEDPRGYIPGNRMSFAGLRKEDERDDVIAFLEQYSDPDAVAADHADQEDSSNADE